MRVSLSRIPSRRLRIAAAICGVIGTAGCTPLGALNGLIPVDASTRVAVRDVPYGQLPRQKLDVYAPDKITGRAPVVVFIYGGSWNSGAKADYAFIGRSLASQGFVTAVIDYRLVPQVRFPSFLDDGALAVRWVQDNIATYGGDASRIYLMGHSAGAYNAAMIALDPRYLAKAGVRDGTVKKVAALAGPYDFLPFDGSLTRETFGAWKTPAETQPVNFARAKAPRMFLATGSDDTTVLPRNTDQLAAKLQAAGGRVETKIYQGVGHPGILLALSAPFASNAPVLADVVNFFNSP